MKTVLSITTLFLLIGGVICSAQSDAPSLAEIARQNQSGKKAVKVFTDDNTQRTAPPVEEQKVATAGTAPDQKKAHQSLSPAAARVAELQKTLASLKQNQAGWSSSAKTYENKLANETSDFRRQVYQEALENDRKNIESYQNQINEAQKALTRAREAAASSPNSGVKTQASATDSSLRP